MTRLRSGPLAAWASAWLDGQVASDEVLRAVTGDDAPHRVAGLQDEVAPLSELLIQWRRGGGPVRVVLPVAGDVRGLPGPPAFRSAALDAGEAVYAGGLGAVPEVVDFAPSSAPCAVTWLASPVEVGVEEYLSVSDAQYELTTAIRETATALAAADVAGAAEGLGELLRDARRAGERLNLPPGFPPRAVALVSQSERMQAVLDLALADPIGGAVDRMGMAARDSALRPLAGAVRRARMAGYNAASV